MRLASLPWSRSAGKSVTCGAIAGACVVLAAAVVGPLLAQQAVSPEELRAAIDKLGVLEFSTRMNAARTVRRAPAAQAVPALIQAVTEHADGYVRFRALVLLTGFTDPRTKELMVRLLDDPNDRLREVAFGFFEHNPDTQTIGLLLRALEREQSEFVRPRLVRAVAAHGSDVRVQETLLREVGRGQDFFRSAVIEALGDYRGQYAASALLQVVELDGPLQDDAAIALGKIGDKRVLETLAALQRRVPRETQPALAAAVCLLGVNCAAHQDYLIRTLRFAVDNPGFQELLRAAAAGLAAMAQQGNAATLDALLDIGIGSRDPARAPLALALATVALRQTPLFLMALEKNPNRTGVAELLSEGFDMLEEDYEEERFFVTVRRAYWQAQEGAPARQAAEMLIQKLEF